MMKIHMVKTGHMIENMVEHMVENVRISTIISHIAKT